MDDSYKKFKEITDKYYADGKMPNIYVFVELLNFYGIKLRQKNGELCEATFSVPKSKNALVLGMRYLKKDGSYSEDLFLFEENKTIVRGYKGKVEKILPEYKNTHKGLPNT